MNYNKSVPYNFRDANTQANTQYDERIMMNSPYSSSWGSELNSNDNPYQTEGLSTFSPPPLKVEPNNAPAPTQDTTFSIADLLTELLEQNQPEAKSEAATVTSSHISEKVLQTQPETSLTPAPVETSQVYAWLTQQENEETRQEDQRERKQLLTKVGLGVGAVLLAGLLLVIILGITAKPVVVPFASAPLATYPGATKIAVPTKLNEDIRKAFLTVEQPRPSSVEATYYLTNDQTDKVFSFFKTEMANQGYQKQIAIDTFLSAVPETKNLNAKGLSFTNASPRGYALLVIPASSNLLPNAVKSGDILIAVVNIQN